jgi:hypothetical protein
VARSRRSLALAVTLRLLIGVQPDYELRQADGSTITVRPSVFLQRLAAATGGTFVLHRDSDWIPRQLDAVLLQLRQQ